MFCASLLAATALSDPSHATPLLLATGTLTGSADLSGRTDTLENGNSQSILGGLGSGLAYAGGNTFLATPDRGPNALAYNANVNDTTSYIARFQTVQMALAPSGGGALPFTLTPTLTATTLLYSASPLNYGANPGGTQINGAPMPSGDAINAGGNKFYFSGRSDNFGTTYGAATGSANQQNARFDPEGIRVSADGKSVFISDEYGPYLYQFDRATGERIRTYTLPGYSSFLPGSSTPAPAGNVYVPKVSADGAREDVGGALGNTTGRVQNKGMEGLAITPDGKTLVGILQAPTIQDSGSKLLRIVTVDVATGATHEYGYLLTAGTGVSEIVALNDHQFIVDERDGKGLGDDSKAVNKKLYLIDLAGATDITDLGTTAASAVAVAKTEVGDFVSLLGAAGIGDRFVPAKIEGLAFGQDVTYGGAAYHTLFVATDNDFLATTTVQSNRNVPNPSQFFVLGYTDAELRSVGASFTAQAFDVPEAGTLALVLPGLAGMFAMASARRRPASEA